MPPSLPDSDRSPIRILIAMTAVALVGLSAILSVILWLGIAFDRSSQTSARMLVRAGLEDAQDRLAATAAAFAHRETLHTAVRYRLRGLVDDDLASLVSDVEAFDFVLVTDSSGLPRYAYYAEPGWTGPDSFPRTISGSLLKQLTSQAVDTGGSVSGTYRVVDRFAAFTATAIWPAGDPRSNDPPTDFLIAGKYLDPLGLPVTRDLVQNQDLRLVLGDIVPQPGRNFVRLRDASGLTVGALIWTPRRPGTDILRNSAPVVGLGCLVLIISVLLVFKAARRLHAALRREGRAARTDALTGLANRHGLSHFRQRPMVQSALRSGELAVLYMDLNGFKRLNDIEGHAMGDTALQRTADMLRESIRSNDFVARVGGDEFLCVVTGPDARRIAGHIADRICTRTSEPFEVDARSYVVSPAIGVAVARPGETWDTLVERADERMFTAKRSARVDAGEPDRAASAA